MVEHAEKFPWRGLGGLPTTFKVAAIAIVTPTGCALEASGPARSMVRARNVKAVQAKCEVAT